MHGYLMSLAPAYMFNSSDGNDVANFSPRSVVCWGLLVFLPSVSIHVLDGKPGILIFLFTHCIKFLEHFRVVTFQHLDFCF